MSRNDSTTIQLSDLGNGPLRRDDMSISKKLGSEDFSQFNTITGILRQV